MESRWVGGWWKYWKDEWEWRCIWRNVVARGVGRDGKYNHPSSLPQTSPLKKIYTLEKLSVKNLAP
jgi:hypothetical protein